MAEPVRPRMTDAEIITLIEANIAQCAAAAQSRHNLSPRYTRLKSGLGRLLWFIRGLKGSG